MKVQVYVAQVEKTVAAERIMLRGLNRSDSMMDMTLVLRNGEDYGRYKAGDVVEIQINPLPVSKTVGGSASLQS